MEKEFNIESVLKVPVTIKKDQDGKGWIYLCYFGMNDARGMIYTCTLTQDARSAAWTHKYICRSKYTKFSNVSLPEATAFLKMYCDHFNLDPERFRLVVKFPTLQLI